MQRTLLGLTSLRSWPDGPTTAKHILEHVSMSAGAARQHGSVTLKVGSVYVLWAVAGRSSRPSCQSSLDEVRCLRQVGIARHWPVHFEAKQVSWLTLTGRSLVSISIFCTQRARARHSGNLVHDSQFYACGAWLFLV